MAHRVSAHRSLIGPLAAFTVAGGLIGAGEAVSAEEAVTSRWINDNGGTWVAGSNWSTSPYAPRNDVPAGRTYHAVIDGRTGQSGIGLDGNLTLDAITLDAREAHVYHRRGVVQTVAGPIDLRNGTWNMGLASPGGATIRDTVITSTANGGNGQIAIHDRGYLDNVTLGVPVVFRSVPGGHLIVSRGLTFAPGGRIVTELDCTIEFRGVPRVEGEGEIVFVGGGRDRGGIIRATDDIGTIPRTVTFGPGIVVRAEQGTGRLESEAVNEGTVSAETGGSIGIFWRFENRGVVQAVNGGSLELNLGYDDARSWRNEGPGVLRLGEASSLHLHGSIAEGALGRFERSGGTVVIHGEWDNVGRTVPLDAFGGGWEVGDTFNRATLRGGTYVAAGGRDTVRVPAGSKARFVQGVRVDADVEVGVEGLLRVGGDFTLNGTMRMGGGAELAGEAATIAGRGTIVFDDTGQRHVEPGRVSVAPLSSRPVGLRIGPEIVLEARAGQVVLGTEEDTGTAAVPGAIVNDGEIVAAAAQPIWLVSKVQNAGRMVARGTGGVISRTEFLNDGELRIEAGSAVVNRGSFVQGSNGVVGGAGTWRQLEGASTFDGRQEWQPGARMSIEGGSLVLRSNAGTAAGTALSLSVASGAAVRFETRQRLRSLTIDGAGSMAEGAGTLYTLDLSPGSDGRLDLGDNRLIVDRESPAAPGFDPVHLRRWIRRGYAEGTWSGPGLTSSIPQNDDAKALGYAAAEQLGLRPGDRFAGETLVHPRAALVVPTLFGDGTLDGRVDVVDLDSYLRGLMGLGGGEWTSGDYNYDGVTDVSGDFPLFIKGYRAGHGDVGTLVDAIEVAAIAGDRREALIALVPEPAAAAMLALSILCAGSRRRRARPGVRLNCI